jgi:hypothetical protein
MEKKNDALRSITAAQLLRIYLPCTSLLPSFSCHFFIVFFIEYYLFFRIFTFCLESLKNRSTAEKKPLVWIDIQGLPDELTYGSGEKGVLKAL